MSQPPFLFAAQSNPAVTGSAETYLLTSVDFETEFTTALEAEPMVVEVLLPTTEQGACSIEPPVVAESYGEINSCSAAMPPVVVACAKEESAPPAVDLAPRNIFSATFALLISPFRSTLARETIRLMPTWGCSMLVHMLVLLGLALYAYHEIRSPKPTTLELAMSEAPGIGEPDELDHEMLVPSETALPVTIDSPQVAEMVVDQGDILAVPDVPIAITPETIEANLSELAANPLLSGKKSGATDAKQDKSGKGTVELLENETSFFGIKGTAKKFCFIVDNSKSMTGVRFRTALAELLYSVEKLQPDQVFYVCFFSDGAYPLFFPNINREMIPATAENKAKFREWLRFVELGPATYGSAAMKIGLDLEPEVLYLLGDGDFQDDTVREVLKRANAKTRIHAIGLDIAPRSRADAGFAAIARAFYGTYRNIRLMP